MALSHDRVLPVAPRVVSLSRSVVAPAATVGESSTARHTPPKERAVWRAVFGIMMASLELECWALVRDLPYPEVDEPVFVRPAVAS